MSSGGIIPANTGKIKELDSIGFDYKDHPREYGENGSLSKAAVDLLGSSPRIRGKSNDLWKTSVLRRIIPANTGKIVCPLAG